MVGSALRADLGPPQGGQKVGAWLRRALRREEQGQALPLPRFALRRTGYSYVGTQCRPYPMQTRPDIPDDLFALGRVERPRSTAADQGWSALPKDRAMRSSIQPSFHFGWQVAASGGRWRDLSIQSSTQSSTQPSIQSSHFTPAIRHLSSIQPSTLPLYQGIHSPITQYSRHSSQPPTANRQPLTPTF